MFNFDFNFFFLWTTKCISLSLNISTIFFSLDNSFLSFIESDFSIFSCKFFWFSMIILFSRINFYLFKEIPATRCPEVSYSLFYRLKCAESNGTLLYPCSREKLLHLKLFTIDIVSYESSKKKCLNMCCIDEFLSFLMVYCKIWVTVESLSYFNETE